MLETQITAKAISKGKRGLTEYSKRISVIRKYHIKYTNQYLFEKQSLVPDLNEQQIAEERRSFLLHFQNQQKVNNINLFSTVLTRAI